MVDDQIKSPTRRVGGRTEACCLRGEHWIDNRFLWSLKTMINQQTLARKLETNQRQATHRSGAVDE